MGTHGSKECLKKSRDVRPCGVVEGGLHRPYIQPMA